MMNELWLPEGPHWGLNISHNRRPDAGAFIPAAAPKTVWHTTEGISFSGAESTLISDRDEPHVLVSVDGLHVVQFIPFNRSSKSLMHPANTPETNRAHCIQIEVCGRAADSGNWTAGKYRHLAALAVLIEHRCKVQRITHISWARPHRIAADRFAATGGHIGHMHVPNNDHVDPGTGFKIGLLLKFMEEAERRYQ